MRSGCSGTECAEGLHIEEAHSGWPPLVHKTESIVRTQSCGVRYRIVAYPARVIDHDSYSMGFRKPPDKPLRDSGPKEIVRFHQDIAVAQGRCFSRVQKLVFCSFDIAEDQCFRSAKALKVFIGAFSVN